MLQLRKGRPLPPKDPSVTQWLALQLFRRMPDGVRGLLGLLLVVASVYLAMIHLPVVSILVAIFAVMLFVTNFRHSLARHRS